MKNQQAQPVQVTPVANVIPEANVTSIAQAARVKRPITLSLKITVLFFLYTIVMEQVVAATEAERRPFDVNYTVTFELEQKLAKVNVSLGKHAEDVYWIRFRVDPERHFGFQSTIKGEKPSSVDKTLALMPDSENHLLWTPNQQGTTLSYSVRINHRRKDGRFDALFQPNWALFRGDNLIPPARVKIEYHTKAEARLRFNLPSKWNVATAYKKGEDGTYLIDNPYRLFDRPTGWMVAGDIGVKRENIKGIRVAVAAPKGQSVRRMDMLSHLRWNLPALLKIFPDFPKRLLIVSANDPMWRGALSGPSSLYIHADRPLISEDGTSSLLHELIHVAMSARSGPESDWIVEGMAEYYSLKIMRNSKTISKRRFKNSLQALEKKGKSVKTLKVSRSHGAITAKAVGVMHQLDQYIRKETENKKSLDGVIHLMAVSRKKITLNLLEQSVKAVADRPLPFQVK